MPNYKFKKASLINNINKLKSSFANADVNFQIFYSIKTNYSDQVVGTVIESGCELEIVSDYEWSIIKKNGLKNLVLNGPSKSIELVRDILNSSVEKLRFNIDNDTDVDLLLSLTTKELAKMEVGIRVYPNKSGIWNRFGFDIDSSKFLSIFQKVKHLICGFHFHFSTNNFKIENYELVLQKIYKVVSENSIELKYIDIGGGLPGSSELLYHKAMYDDLPNLIKKYIRDDILVISEVGRNLVEDVMDLETKIVSIKDFGDTIDIVIDTNIMHFPCFWEKKFNIEIIPENKILTEPIQVNIFGNSCMQVDKIQEGYFINFKPAVGDTVIITKVGAYSLTQASNFITEIPQII